jgi:hypothetical protein
MTPMNDRISRQRTWHAMAVLGLAGAAIAAFAAGGCADSKSASATTRPANDMFTAQPHVSDEDMNISGGGLGTFDNKAFRRDVDNVLNP